MRDLKLELKVLVDYLFCDLIIWLPYTVSDKKEIRIVETWSRSFLCYGNGRIKNPSEVSRFLESRNLLQRCGLCFWI